MKKKMCLRTGMVMVMVLALVGLAVAVAAQDKPADNMQAMREKVKADKKLLVASNMQLTESEAKAFWPVYEDYQKDLMGINQRIGKLIESYAADYRANTLTDEKAKKLVDELVAIEQAEAGLKASYVPKLSKVLPMKKVARYMQVENKVRAMVKYELAGQIPLVPLSKAGADGRRRKAGCRSQSPRKPNPSSGRRSLPGNAYNSAPRRFTVFRKKGAKGKADRAYRQNQFPRKEQRKEQQP